jgi:hypothetical protein
VGGREALVVVDQPVHQLLKQCAFKINALVAVVSLRQVLTVSGNVPRIDLPPGEDPALCTVSDVFVPDRTVPLDGSRPRTAEHVGTADMVHITFPGCVDWQLLGGGIGFGVD